MLTDRAIRALQPFTRAYKVTDDRGLYLFITKAGAKCWRFDYTFAGKRKTLAIGTYPDVSLKQARDLRDDAKRQLKHGIDPASRHGIGESLEEIAREWHGRNTNTWTDGHAQRILARLERNIFPWIGQLNINAIDAPLLLQTLRRIEARGAHETAHRVLSICGRVFRYGVATGRCKRDPSGDLRGALTPTNAKHFSSIIDPRELGRLLRDLDNYQGTFIVRQALRLGLYVFVRPGELRQAEWREIDTGNGEWRIPAEKMKMRRTHIVPLSAQAISIIDELRPLTGDSKYLFPSLRSNDRPMSENTVNAALRRLGYSKDEITGHGFRTTASTLLHEQGWPSDAIERQLAHAETNKVKGVYNYAEHLPERRKMMQAWADYLDGLKAGADIVNFKIK